MAQNALISCHAKAPTGVGQPANSDRPIRHLNQVDLARRWNLSPRTLERWRWLRQGPRYLKIGGRIVYRLDDIEVYELIAARPSHPRSIWLAAIERLGRAVHHMRHRRLRQQHRAAALGHHHQRFDGS